MKFLILSLLLLSFVLDANAAGDDIFSDKALSSDIVLPSWFKLSFLDLQDDLDEAVSEKKKGIIVYFGRKDCPYCKALLEKNWTRKDIVHYTKKNFDVIAINTKGTRNVTDIDGFVYDEKNYSLNMKTNFTPSLLFINSEGKIAFKLSGYHNPYRFMAALEYVADSHYKTQSFKSYLSQAKGSLASAGGDDLNHQDYFSSAPHNLDRSRFPGERAMAVFFEKKNCHACDILHSNPLENEIINKHFQELDVIQVDVDKKEKIVTPSGVRTNTLKWSEQLELHYSPTIIFFDEAGKEIIRIDSVVWLHRLDRVLEFITLKAYKRFPSFQAWRLSKN